MNRIQSLPEGIIENNHRFPFRVYYEDTDFGGVVYYSNYLKFAERGRTEMLREIGFKHQVMKDKLGVGFVVRTCNADYQKPAHLDDLLEVETKIIEVSGASIQMRQTITRDNETLVVMDVKLACMSSEGAAVRIPKEVQTRMAKLIISNGED